MRSATWIREFPRKAVMNRKMLNAEIPISYWCVNLAEHSCSKKYQSALQVFSKVSFTIVVQVRSVILMSGDL